MTKLTYRHPCDADPFLKNLKPNNELDSTTNMKDTGSVTANGLGHNIPEHVEVAVELPRIPLHFCNISDILELGLGAPSIILPSESPKYVACFIVSSNLDKPTGRFW